MRPTYIFLDESGNFDFSVKGTRFFVLTSVSTRRPFPWSSSLDSYKYDCLENNLEIERFHCSADKLRVRKKVFEIISKQLDAVRIDSLVVEKPKTGTALRADERFYPEMLGYLLRYVLNSEMNEVIVITDRIPVKKKRNAIEKGIKGVLANILPEGTKYRIHHHESRSHYGLQVADYCCWAIYQKWVNGKTQYYNLIRDAVLSEFDIFRTGTRYYYGRDLWAEN